MNLRYHLDPDTGQPHIYGHGVTEQEVEYVLARPGEEMVGRNGAREALGQTADGRYLRVIFVPDEKRTSAFVVTAFELTGNHLHAFRRRRRRRRRT